MFSLKEICRICLEENMDLKNVAELDSYYNTIEDQLIVCFPDYDWDFKDYKVCSKCVDDLSFVHNFRQNVLNAEYIYNKIISNCYGVNDIKHLKIKLIRSNAIPLNSRQPTMRNVNETNKTDSEQSNFDIVVDLTAENEEESFYKDFSLKINAQNNEEETQTNGVVVQVGKTLINKNIKNSEELLNELLKKHYFEYADIRNEYEPMQQYTDIRNEYEPMQAIQRRKYKRKGYGGRSKTRVKMYDNTLFKNKENVDNKKIAEHQNTPSESEQEQSVLNINQVKLGPNSSHAPPVRMTSPVPIPFKGFTEMEMKICGITYVAEERILKPQRIRLIERKSKEMHLKTVG